MVSPQLFLFAVRRCFATDDGAGFVGLLKLAAGGEHTVTASRLIVRDASGREALVQAKWLALDGQRLRGPLVRAPLAGWLPMAPGDHVAEWQLDDLHAAPVAFSVAERRSDEPDFWPPRLDWLGPPAGIAGEPDLLVRLTNPGTDVLELDAALAGSRLILDGTAYGARPGAWSAASNIPSQLTPGESTSLWLDFARYQRPSPGRHQLAVELAGARSNLLTLAL
jgi:hypothetical protein